MRFKFVGVGSAFAPLKLGQSNMLLIANNGNKMLIDCGMSSPYLLRDELGITPQEIDSIWISHAHADHIGGLEWMAFVRFFQPVKHSDGSVIKLKLMSNPIIMKELWDHSLMGGLESVEGKVMHLTDYFNCVPVPDNHTFEWEGYKFTPVQTIHVMSGYVFKHSYGLMIENPRNYKTFVTTDTQFCPYQLRKFYKEADIIFHDCETAPYKSHVHAHYDDLKTLDLDVKQKMWLYHYQTTRPTAKEDGFAGFVEKYQEFDI